MKKIAVVFVHGFTGGSDTWKNSQGVSFSMLLGQDDNFNESCDFFEFEYFTELLGFFNSNSVQTIIASIPFVKKLGYAKKVKSNQTLDKLALLLDSFMKINLSNYDEVIIVAHSMGGLVAKEYIINYEYPLGPKPIGFISLAVPHKGSIQSYLLSPTLNKNAKQLRPLDEHLNKINDDWTAKKDELPESIYVTALHDQYVVSTSSEPYKIKKSQRFTVDQDHNSICKPDSPATDSYKVVSDFIRTISYQRNMKVVSNTEYNPDNVNYNKEIFVIKMILEGIHNKGMDDAKESFFQAEIISKAADKKDQAILRELQTKVMSLYRQCYVSCSDKESSEIFSSVHEKLLQQDGLVLKTAVDYINFIHKKGLLHQLANLPNTDVVWSDNTTMDKILGCQK